MGKIAFVGATGCGKTVLLTVLTQTFSQADESVQFIPASRDTIKYITKKWNELRAGEWPAPTPPASQPPTYSWTIKRGPQEETFITSDVAGEAWQDFISENVDDADQDALQQQASQLKQYKGKWQRLKNALNPFQQEMVRNNKMSLESLLMDASGIAIIVNLDSIINQEKGYKDQMWLLIAVQKFLKRNGRASVPVALVLSQFDKYQYLLQNQDIPSILRQYLPFSTNFKTILPVSAVADTVRSKPKLNFTSIGLKQLVDWMMGAIQKERWFRLAKKNLIILGKCALILLLLWGIYQIFPRKMPPLPPIITKHPPKSFFLKEIRIKSFGKWDPIGSADVYVMLNGESLNTPNKDQGDVTLHLPQYEIKPGFPYTISVWDKDIENDDSMGSFTVSAHDFSWPKKNDNETEEQNKTSTIKEKTLTGEKGFTYTVILEAQY